VTDTTSAMGQLSDRIRRGELVKICGLREPEHTAAAVIAGADFIGFIFAPARRQVSSAEARSCVVAARRAAAGRAVYSVGVFVDAALSEIEAIVDETELDAVQLHGAEPPELIESLPVPAFKALRPSSEWTSGRVISEMNRYRTAATPPVAILIDGYAEHSTGGTGTRADWMLASEISAKSPVFLAGGLDPENVRDAIRHVRPHGVDVSSGVEIDGVKDPARIVQFIRAARAAFQDAAG
jgi:phosphoribosylanthranilate isomerase